TLGSAAAWPAAGGCPASAGRGVRGGGAGLVVIRRGGGTSASAEAGESLAFAAPERLRTGGLDEAFLARIVAALGIEPADVVDHQWADNGPGWAALRLRSADQVLGLEPDFSSVPEAKIGVLGAHPDGSEHEYEIRAFAPGVGVPEDPVTGSLNASVAQWLIGAGLAPNSYTLTQGTALGRAGVVSISAEDDEVWVGGATTVCFRGTALV